MLCKGQKIFCLWLQNLLVATRQSHLPCLTPIRCADKLSSKSGNKLNWWFHLSEQNLSYTKAFIWDMGNPSPLSAIQSRYWMKLSLFFAEFTNNRHKKLLPFFCSLIHCIINFIFQLEKVQQIILRKCVPKSVPEG